MPETVPSPLQRLVLAFYAFFAILFRAEVAAAVHRLREARRAGALPAAEPGGERIRTAGSAAAAAASPPAAPSPAAPPAPAAAPSPAPSPAPAAASAAPAAAPAPAARGPAPAAAPAAAPDARSALHLLALLQREGRLVDFVEEDLVGFPDATIGAAARTVHAGCRKALAELFELEPVLREREGAPVTVERGFDPSAIRLTGNVVGEAPFRGALRHHGWRAREVKLTLPPGGVDPAILAPAEVEL